MSSSAFDIKRLIYTAKTTKRFWIPLAIVVLAGVNVSMVFMPKTYQSSATVLINKPKLTALTGPAGQVLTIQDQLATIRETLTSFTFLDHVARRLNLGQGMSPESKEYQALIDVMRTSIDLRVKGQDLFTLVYTSSRPEWARDIATEIVNEYITQSSESFETDTKKYEEFISKELKLAEIQMAHSQKAVTDYKEQYPNEIPDVQSENITRLHKLEEDQATAEGQLNGLRNTLAQKKKELQDTPAQIMAQTTTQDNAYLANLLRTKKNAESSITFLLQDYTEDHWKVKEARQQLKQIEQEIATAQNTTTQTETRAANPKIQILNTTINDTEVQITQTQSNIDKMTQEIATLQAWQKQVPQRQAELEQLMLAVSNDHARVDQLHKSMTDAETATNVEDRGQGPSFELFDPPRLQPDPVAPNPKKFIVLSIALALASSGGLVYLLMLLDGALRSVDEARRLLQMPVLGVVQRVMTATDALRQARRRRFRTVGFGLGAVVLLGVIALGMTVLRQPLQDQVEKIRTLLSK